MLQTLQQAFYCKTPPRESGRHSPETEDWAVLRGRQLLAALASNTTSSSDLSQTDLCILQALRQAFNSSFAPACAPHTPAFLLFSSAKSSTSRLLAQSDTGCTCRGVQNAAAPALPDNVDCTGVVALPPSGLFVPPVFPTGLLLPSTLHL